jgi:benzoyl-CoA reductase/2-hydroxyglutaryl-CoA dehydratase subunit BcrC/BadD/HgdB
MDKQFNKPFNFIQESLLETALENGSIPIGYTCNYAPTVLFSAGNLFPYRVNARGVSGTEVADIYLSQVTCSYTRSILEYVMDDRLEFIQGWVFAAGCDHLRRLYDNLQYLITPEFCYILDTPHKCGEHAISWFEQELKKLASLLSKHFQLDINENSVSETIKTYNQLMKNLKTFSDLRKEDPPFSGAEFQRLLSLVWTLPYESTLQLIDNLYDQLHNRKCPIDYRARILLISSVIDQYEWIESIENVGALVVADRFCTGAIPGIKSYPESDNPFNDIARHMLQTNACPRMMDTFDYRISLLLQSIKDFHVDGVIVAPMKFCDIWGVETTLLMSILRENNVPTLRLEREYSPSGEGQLHTRVQAFLEQMKC